MTDGRDPGDRSAEPPSRGDGAHADVVAGVEAALDARVVRARPLSGGQIGRVVRVDLAGGRRLVAKAGPTPLSVEGRMLRYLAEESPLPVPAVHHAGDDLLVLAYVPGDDPVTPAVERDLADRLAACHAVTAEAAGFPFDTLSGRLAQPNPWTDSWIEFFRTHRLGHAADAARDNGTLPAALHDRVRALAADLDDLVVEPDAPALLHGDV
jgi:fructosamine-3-kinase